MIKFRDKTLKPAKPAMPAAEAAKPANQEASSMTSAAKPELATKEVAK